MEPWSNNHLKKKRYPKSITIIKGGKERSDSSLIAIKYLKNSVHELLKNK